MSVGELFLYELPSAVHLNFCLVMDTLSDLDWTRFASMVLDDQTALRFAEKQEKRTDWVMNRWGSRNGRVSELLHLLEGLQLLRPRDVILDGVSSLKPADPPPRSSSPPPLPLPVAPSPVVPPSESSGWLPTAEKVLPKPAPPPFGLQSEIQPPHQPTPPHQPHTQPSMAETSCTRGMMCWSYEEVHTGTKGFSPSLQVGEGGFGVVYKATLRNTVCAVKVLKQDQLLDCKLLKESFQTEMEKLSKFRHPNIIDLLGFSEGPGTVCLIYNYMENKSLEHKLHNQSSGLSWSQRVSVVTGASTALQFLHCPPSGNTPLIHGDVKSSNILLDHHMTAKLGDFGLARFAPEGSRSSPTTTLGYTATVRGTVAYLPDEYLRKGQLGTSVDVYSFGVVLLEVLTGRRALDNDEKSGGRYLKDLVDEIKESPSGSSQETWRKQLDGRLLMGGSSEPAGCMEIVALACRCLDKNKRRRPAMAEVFNKLQDISSLVNKSISTSLQQPFQSFSECPPHMDFSVKSLSQKLSKMGPLEDTYQPAQNCQSSSSSSSFCSRQSPLRFKSLSSLVSSSSPRSLSPSSFAGPCETDESRGFSQYDLPSQPRTNGTAWRSASPSTKDQYHSPTCPPDQSNQPSVPTEEQYSVPLQPSSTSSFSGTGRPFEPEPRRQLTAGVAADICGVPPSLSPVRSLQSVSPRPSVLMNPSKQHFLQKKTLYEEGRIQTPDLLSSDDIYGGMSSAGFGGPEESDELDSLPAERH